MRKAAYGLKIVDDLASETQRRESVRRIHIVRIKNCSDSTIDQLGKAVCEEILAILCADSDSS
jgi:hypothetical protein